MNSIFATKKTQNNADLNAMDILMTLDNKDDSLPSSSESSDDLTLRQRIRKNRKSNKRSESLTLMQHFSKLKMINNNDNTVWTVNGGIGDNIQY